MNTTNAVSPLATDTLLVSQPRLLRHLHRLHQELRKQCREGWDVNAMLQVHAELARLAREVENSGADAVGEQLLALRTALTPAVTRGRIPDNGTTALVAALNENLGHLLPAPGKRDDAETPLAPPTTAIAANADSRILIVGLGDDEVACLFPALQEHAGFDVLHVAEPLGVLEELSRFQPDLVALNLHMQVCESTDLAGMIREREDCTDLPIVFLASSDVSDCGVSDIVSTTQGPDQLVAELSQHLEQAGKARAEGDLREPGRERDGRRAWLLDRLEASLTSTGLQRGGLLDIGIDKLDALRRDNPPSELRAIHRQLGQLIGQSLEAADILAETARGFLVLCRERSVATLHALGDELLGSVRRERFGSRALPLSVSIGGCVFGDNLDQVDAVLNAAWRARRAAGAGQIGWRDRGDGCIEPRMLGEALGEERLHLVYQAIVDLGEGHAPQYQALLRLRDHDGFVHTAGEILPVARDSGQIPRLDQWSLDHGLKLLAVQQRRMRPLRLFVSQSSETLHECDYPAWLGERLRHFGVRGPRLVLEFRCDDISESPQELLRVAPRIRDLGVGLALSGVNRGLHSAQLLDALPLDYVKLDPSLNPSPASMTAIAHARGIAVIASRIEEESQLRKLRDADVDFAQGHSLAHPSRSLNYRFSASDRGVANRRA